VKCLDERTTCTRYDKAEKELDGHRPERRTPAFFQMSEKVDHAPQDAAEHSRLPVPPPNKHFHRMTYQISEHIDNAMWCRRILDDLAEAVVLLDRLRCAASSANDLHGGGRYLEIRITADTL
jgi:hypothetical protein